MGHCKKYQRSEEMMLELIPKIIAYKIMHKYGIFKLMPINLTVSVLYSCNSRCKTCNIWKKEAKNLTLSEYELIFKKIGKAPYWITISGGEPFLRKDLPAICEIIYRNSKPTIINIPSNGILTDKIVDDVKKICKTCKKSQIIINLSVDGIGKQHDEIRQVPDNYKKLMKTYSQLQELNLNNLSVGLHTVISRFNVQDFPKIANMLLSMNPDSYITEIAEEREELDTKGENITPSLISYRSAIDFLIHRIKNNDFKKMNKITQAFRIEYYNLVKKNLRDRTQVIPCYAGIASAQIAPDGHVWSCCIKAKSLGNLRHHDYKFKKIWFNKKAKAERISIKHKECYCPLANASYTNMLMDIPTIMRVFYRSFIKWWS